MYGTQIEANFVGLFVIVDTCSVKWQVLILDESLFFQEAIYSFNLQEGHNMYFFLVLNFE